MAPVRTSHQTDPLPAPYAIPRNPHSGKDGLGTIDKPIATTQYQNQLPKQSRAAIPILPRPRPHRLAGQNWPSTSTDLGGDARLERNVGRGRGRGRGKNRVVPITRAGKGRPRKGTDIKAEPVSPSPKTLVNIDREEGPEPVSGIDVLEGLDIKAEPDIQSSPTLMRDHDQHRPHSSSHLFHDGQSNEIAQHPSRVPIVRLNQDVVKDSSTLKHQGDQRLVDYRVPAPNAVFNNEITSNEVYPSHLPSQKAHPTDQATTVDTQTVDDTITRSSSSTATSVPPPIAPLIRPALEPALPIVARPIRRPPSAQAVPTQPPPATSLLNIDPCGFGVPADLLWFEDDGFTPRADEYSPDGIAFWVVECENVLKHIKSLPPRLPLRGTAQERTRAAIYLRKLIGEWITLVFDDHLVGDPPTTVRLLQYAKAIIPFYECQWMLFTWFEWLGERIIDRAQHALRLDLLIPLGAVTSLVDIVDLLVNLYPRANDSVSIARFRHYIAILPRRSSASLSHFQKSLRRMPNVSQPQ